MIFRGFGEEFGEGFVSDFVQDFLRLLLSSEGIRSVREFLNIWPGGEWAFEVILCW